MRRYRGCFSHQRMLNVDLLLQRRVPGSGARTCRAWCVEGQKEEDPVLEQGG